MQFTMRQMKSLISEQEGIPVGQMRLLSAGQELQDDVPLSSQNISPSDPIYLVLRSDDPGAPTTQVITYLDEIPTNRMAAPEALEDSLRAYGPGNNSLRDYGPGNDSLRDYGPGSHEDGSISHSAYGRDSDDALFGDTLSAAAPRPEQSYRDNPPKIEEVDDDDDEHGALGDVPADPPEAAAKVVQELLAKWTTVYKK